MFKWIFITGMLLGALFYSFPIYLPSVPKIEYTEEIPLVSQNETTPSLKRVYPFSVIPGGVFSKGELLGYMSKDKLVSEHYRAFNVDRVKLVRLTSKQEMHVSYRKEGKIYWTKRKIILYPGELLITDGVIFARARCGNQLSFELGDKPILEDEPELEYQGKKELLSEGTDTDFIFQELIQGKGGDFIFQELEKGRGKNFISQVRETKYSELINSLTPSFPPEILFSPFPQEVMVLCNCCETEEEEPVTVPISGTMWIVLLGGILLFGRKLVI